MQLHHTRQFAAFTRTKLFCPEHCNLSYSSTGDKIKTTGIFPGDFYFISCSTKTLRELALDLSASTTEVSGRVALGQSGETKRLPGEKMKCVTAAGIILLLPVSSKYPLWISHAILLTASHSRRSPAPGTVIHRPRLSVALTCNSPLKILSRFSSS